MSGTRPSDDRSWSYIATIPCGCIVAAAVDEPRFANDTAEFVAAEIKRGYSVTRVPTDEVTPGRWVINWPHDHDAAAGEVGR